MGTIGTRVPHDGTAGAVMLACRLRERMGRIRAWQYDTTLMGTVHCPEVDEDV